MFEDSTKDGKPYSNKIVYSVADHCFLVEKMSLREVNDALNVRYKKAPELYISPGKFLFLHLIAFNYCSF